MKKTIILIIALFIANLGFSQDFIYLKDGTLIQGFVREANNMNIVYTYTENAEGEKLSINPERVLKIVYANGYEKVYSGKTSSSSRSNETNEDFYMTGPRGFTLGVGWGISYGGAGVRAQYKVGRKMGFALHGGLGYFPHPEGGGSAWSIGGKFYYYKWLYFNLQGGVAGYEYEPGTPLYGGGYSDGYYYDVVIPSIMLGGDFIFGEHFGFNSAIGRSFNRGPDFWSIDLGFIFKF